MKFSRFLLPCALGILCLVSAPAISTAQDGVSIATSNVPPNAYAMLDVIHTNKGILIPRVDFSRVDMSGSYMNPAGTGAEGLLVYVTNGPTPGYYYWDESATSWTRIADGNSIASYWQPVSGSPGSIENLNPSGSVVIKHGNVDYGLSVSPLNPNNFASLGLNPSGIKSELSFGNNEQFRMARTSGNGFIFGNTSYKYFSIDGGNNRVGIGIASLSDLKTSFQIGSSSPITFEIPIINSEKHPSIGFNSYLTSTEQHIKNTSGIGSVLFRTNQFGDLEIQNLLSSENSMGFAPYFSFTRGEYIVGAPEETQYGRPMLKILTPGTNQFLELGSSGNEINTENSDLYLNWRYGQNVMIGNPWECDELSNLTVSGNIEVLWGGLCVGSDSTIKEDIRIIDSLALSKLTYLRGVTYSLKADQTNKTRYGVIAQEVETQYPDIVNTKSTATLGKDIPPGAPSQLKTVDYNAFIALLIEGYKAQQKTIQEQQAIIQNLETRVGNLENQ